MRSLSILSIIFILLIGAAVTVSANDAELEYVMAVSNYFNANSDQVNEIANSYVSIEEAPVVYYIARLASVNPVEVAQKRKNGSGWADVVSAYNLKTDMFYVIASKQSLSKEYNETFAKFKSVTPVKWSELELEDSEYVNLVNLRFIYKYHDYDPYDVMAMKSHGKNFVKINSQVAVQKAKIIEKQVAQVSNK